MTPDSGYTKAFNFNAIASRYDQHRKPGGVFFETLAALATSVDATNILEIGSGTGNSTTAFLEAYPSNLTCIEYSQEMLRHAQAKSLPISLLNGDACALPFEDDTFDFIFAVLVIHHIDDLPSLVRECHRVLKKGRLAFVTASHTFIGNHPMNAYFPSFAEIDKRRFTPIKEVIQELKDAGFNGVGAEYRTRDAEAIDQTFVDKVRDKYISTYELVPEAEFAEGMASLQRDIDAHGQLDERMEWESVVVWADK